MSEDRAGRTDRTDHVDRADRVDRDADRSRIEAAYADREQATRPDVREAVERTVDALDTGQLRVASPPSSPDADWVVHDWVKKAILLYFVLREMEPVEVGPFEYHDKIPLKTGHREAGVRVVPPATVRRGAFVEKGAILMPSYVNIGARVGAQSMVDTWATVGSCAQIGCGVHLSGGVGIGGVLEPPAARPVVVEDGAFLGSRCIVVEGVRVGTEAVLGAGVVLTSSTRIIDVSGAAERVIRGRVPPRSVVIPGSVPKAFPAGTYHVPAALIIGERKASTDRKTTLNEALREFDVSV